VDTIAPELACLSLLVAALSYSAPVTHTGLVSPWHAYTLFLWFTPLFTVGVQISTVANPDSFDDFHTANGSDQLAVPYYESQGTQGCIPVNISALGLPGVTDGSNVTLQLVQDGTSGNLYQVRRILGFFFFLTLAHHTLCRAVHGLDPLLKLHGPIRCPVREYYRHTQLHEQWFSFPYLHWSERWRSFGLDADFGSLEPLCAWIPLFQLCLGNFNL